MAFTKSSRVSSLVTAASMAVSAISVAAPLVVQANTTVNATQLSIQVAPITISGTKLGAEASAAGSGLTNTNNIIPTINAGAIVAGEAPTADAGDTFSYVVSARSADETMASNSLSDTSALFDSFGTFGSQTAKYSGGGAGYAGTIGLTGSGDPAITSASGAGVTTTAIFSTTTNTDLGESLVRRIATAGTDQTVSTASRQGSSYGLSGSGLTAVTGGATVGNSALGAVTSVGTTTGGVSQADVSFSRTETQLVGQASADLDATSTDVTTPAYGIITVAVGGTSAGTITGDSINALGVGAGAAGSTSTLSVVQSYTAF